MKKSLITLCAILSHPLYPLNTTSSVEPLIAHTEKVQIIGSFPKNPEEIAIFAEKAKQEFSKSLEEFLAIPKEKRTFDNTITLWDQIGKRFMNQLIVLKFTDIVIANEKTQIKSEQTVLELITFLSKNIESHPEILSSILFFIQNELKENHLTPAEWFAVNQLISSISLDRIPEPLQENIKALQKAISNIPAEAYTYLPGSLKNKLLPKKKPFSLLNLNVCFLEENQPLLFGGVLPWNMRLEKIAKEIQKLDPDLLCLQEVFDNKAADLLFERLKDSYAHFYVKTAPRSIGFNESSMGLGSGLFIASKFAVKDPQFTLFTGVKTSINRGVFDFIIQSGTQEIAHIYTTHLEAFAKPPAPDIRETQLQEILQKMGSDLEKTKTPIPIILCGDLNINWGSGENAEKLLTSYFFDAYNSTHKDLTMHTRTCVDYTEYWWKAKEDAKQFVEIPQILDYALLLTRKPFSKESYGSFTKNPEKTIQTKVISMNQQEHPLSALTDHHGQFSLIYR